MEQLNVCQWLIKHNAVKKYVRLGTSFYTSSTLISVSYVVGFWLKVPLLEKEREVPIICLAVRKRSCLKGKIISPCGNRTQILGSLLLNFPAPIEPSAVTN
jgi:hypothetical protein